MRDFAGNEAYPRGLLHGPGLTTPWRRPGRRRRAPSGPSARPARCAARATRHRRFAADAPGACGSRFVRCRRCGLVYQDPRPVAEDLHRRYDEAYFAYELANEEAFFELMRRGLADVSF
ncbi:MAG: hypothetical protein MZV64_25900 [Ignavibacteriales bacterium]|nr:hypothetical protein [Ignavibacteriales bacterium]